MASLLDGGEHLTEPIDEVLATRLRNRLIRLGMFLTGCKLLWDGWR